MALTFSQKLSHRFCEILTELKGPLICQNNQRYVGSIFGSQITTKRNVRLTSVLLNSLFDSESRDVLQSFFNRDDAAPHSFCAVVKVANCFVNFRRESFPFRLCSSRFETVSSRFDIILFEPCQLIYPDSQQNCWMSCHVQFPPISSAIVSIFSPLVIIWMIFVFCLSVKSMLVSSFLVSVKGLAISGGRKPCGASPCQPPPRCLRNSS